jgi:hypothetical protein
MVYNIYALQINDLCIYKMHYCLSLTETHCFIMLTVDVLVLLACYMST